MDTVGRLLNEMQQEIHKTHVVIISAGITMRMMVEKYPELEPLRKQWEEYALKELQVSDGKN